MKTSGELNYNKQFLMLSARKFLLMFDKLKVLMSLLFKLLNSVNT